MNKIDIFEDKEFIALPQEKQTQVLTNYFDKNIADDEFVSLPQEKQTLIKQNFINSQLNISEQEKKEAPQKVKSDLKLEEPTKNSFLDKVKDFGKTYVDNVADTFVGARPFGTEDKSKEIKDKAFDTVFGGLGGVQEIKEPLNIENPNPKYQELENELKQEIKTDAENQNKKIENNLIQDIENLSRIDTRLIGDATKEEKDKYLNNIAGILGKGGYALGQRENGDYIAIDKDGNEKDIKNDFFESILDGIKADAGELTGAIYGAKKGFDISKNMKNPVAKVATIAGSSAVGSVAGTALDMGINRLKDRENNLSIEDILNEFSKSAALDLAGNAIGAGVVKVGGKIIELPKQARDYILNGNLNGAREILKKDLGVDEKYIEDALEQAKNNYKEVKEYADKGLTDKSKQQEELLATTLEKGDANIIKGAIASNETAARNLADTIDKRTTTIFDELDNKSSKVGGEEIKNYLNNFEQTAKQDFSNMRKDFSDAFKEIDYKFELEDLKLNETFRDMAKRVQDPDAKKRFLTLQSAIKNTIYDSNAQVGIERDISGLLDMRQQLNRFYGQNERYLTNKKDKDTFNSLKENLDNQIYKAVNDNLPPELGTRLIDSFSKSMDGYRQLGSLQENKVFKSIIGEANSPEFRLNNLVKHMADDDSYVDDVLSKMNPNARQTVEVAVIRELADSFTAKTAQGQRAIAFEDLGKQLEGIQRNVRSELGKETIDNLITYADKFGNKDLLYLDMAKGIATKPKHNIATTIEGKVKMETASMVFQFIQSLKPGDDAKRLALQRHIGKALEKTRTPNEFATKLYEYPDLTDESRNILKSMIKNNNKILAAKNDKEAERLLIEAQEKNQKLINDQEALKEEIENFKTPDIYESRVVSRFADDNKFASFAQLVTRIQKGTATQPDIEQYIKLKNSINPDILEKNILKEKYPENAFSIHKLNDLKSFANEKVNEIISEDEFKSLIYNLDKHNKLPNTSTEMENKYREKFYKLHKLYEEEKAIQKANEIQNPVVKENLTSQNDEHIQKIEELSFEELEKQGLIPFAKFSDNLLAGTVAGVETDEDGNIVGFDPEMFVAGLGGYTALKAALKNKEIQGALKDYVIKIVEYVDMNPAIYKQNGLNAMFVGAKSNEIGAFSDIATKKVMKEIDDSIVTFKPIPKQEVEIEGEFFEQNFGKLGDILAHDELFKQYPNLKEVQVSVNNNIGRGATYNEYINHIALDGGLVKTAENNVIKDLQNKIKELDKNPIDKDYKILNDKFFDKNLPDGEAEKILNLLDNTPTQIEIDKLSNKLSKEIRVNKENSKEVELTQEGKITLLHEIQHAIQEREKWARGGSPANFTKNQLIDEVKQKYSYLPAYKKLEADLHGGKISQDQFDQKMLEWGASDHSGGVRDWQHKQYQRLWGEQQARATSYRANYTPEQRISEDWTNTLEKNEGKYNEPIIKYNNKESQLKAEKENLDRLTQWHKDSHLLTKNEDGTPKVFYHGTTKDFNEFKGNTIWAAEDSKLAYEYALKDSNFNSMGNGENIIPVYINAKNILEIRKPTIKQTEFDFAIEIINNNTSKFKNDKELKEKLLKNIDKLDNETEKPVFEIWDSNKAVVEILKDLGYDGISTTEGASKTVGIFSPEQIKSINNRGTFDKTNPNIMMSQSAKDYKDNQGFYSVLEKTVDEKVGGKIDSVSLAKVLEKNGVKQDELEWSGLKDLLGSKDKLTKEEIQNTINENRLVLEKVEKSDKAKYKDYKIDGGENYRELLFTSDLKSNGLREIDITIDRINNRQNELKKIAGKAKEIPDEFKDEWKKIWQEKEELIKKRDEFKKREPYYSQHWEESNIVVFTRVDDRTIDNKKTLFIEELQSDWHQDGRKKGYGKGTKKVPDAPFKKNWHELGFKRMIQEAVENDYEKIAWTTGKQQASRYSLEKEIDTVVYNKQSGYLQASKNGDEVIFKKVASDEEVANLLGKEITNRLIDPKQSTRENIFVLQGEDVKFGGDGMKAFYDEIVPNTAKKLFKKYNVKPKLEELDDLEEMVWSVEITPKMKEDIKKYGQPLYAIGGALAIGNELSNNGDKDE